MPILHGLWHSVFPSPPPTGGAVTKVPLPKLAFLRQLSYANTQGLMAIEHHELSRRWGGFQPPLHRPYKRACGTRSTSERA